MKNPTTYSTAKAALLAIVSSALCAISANAATLSSNADLIVGFRSSVNTNIVLFNLGSSIAYRDGTLSGTISTPGLSTLLTNAYGSSWFTSSEVSWGIAGVRNNQDPADPFTPPPVVNGDPSATPYLSRNAVTIGGSTRWSGFGATQLLSASTQISSSVWNGAQSFSSITAAAGTSGLGVSTTTASTQWDNGVVPNSDFGLFTGGIEGTLSGGTPYLDLYRILSDTAGATILAGNTTVGRGSYLTTFTINSSGVISTVAIPEPSSYAALAGFAAVSLVAFRRRTKRAV